MKAKKRKKIKLTKILENILQKFIREGEHVELLMRREHQEVRIGESKCETERESERERHKERESYKPRIVGASNHVEAGLALFGVGHTERQAGQLH